MTPPEGPSGTRTNEHGQPIGPALPGWAGARMPAPVTLEGRWVRLEPVAAGHAEDLFEALCGPEDAPLWTYRSEEPPVDAAELARRLAADVAASNRLTFAVVPAGTGQPRGMTTLQRIDAANGSIEVGSIIYARDLQRTPATTEATYLLARHVFDDLGHRRLEWKLDHLNAPSAAAARRLGFTYEGRFRHAMVYKGRSRDTDWFSITDTEWPVVRRPLEAWLAPHNFDATGRQRRALADLR